MKKHLIAAALAPVLALLAGCNTTRTVYVPVENTRVQARADTVRLLQQRTDTVRERDSVVLVQRGDTILLTRTLWRERVRERRDTVYETRRDTVRVSRREPVAVPQELTRWQRVKLKAGGVALALTALLAAYGTCRLFRRPRH